MESRIKMPGLLAFVASPIGRWIKGIVGLFLIFGVATETTFGVLVSMVGLEFLLAALFDVTILGPLMGGPLEGDDLRQALHNQDGRPQLGERSQSWIRA